MSAPPLAPPPLPRARWSRLARKELRETLRDRRTLVTLVLMPLLVYPLLSITFNRFLTTMRPAGEAMWVIAVQPAEAVDVVQRLLERGDRLLTRRETATRGAVENVPKVSLDATADAYGSVKQSTATVGIEVISPAGPRESATWRIIYRDGELASSEAMLFVERRLAAVNERSWRERLVRAGLPQRPLVVSERSVLARARPASLSLAMLVPLILILMTITGAVYPAIDLTAGERERGTLEMLIASPVPAHQLLLAKYVAVVTVAVLTALVNLAAMGVTLSLSGLGTALFGGSGPSPTGVALVVALTFLFAAFFSALLLAITSMARSFKEAQAYLIPVMLLAISPGMLTMMPQVQLNGWLAVVPLVNTALLAREALAGNADLFWVVVVVGTTVLYALCALAVAARIFGTDAVGTVSQAQWRDLWHRARRTHAAPTLSQGLTGLALAFLMHYLLGNLAIVAADRSLPRLLIANAVVTLLVFLGWPWWLSRQRRIILAPTFSLRAPRLFPLLGALLLGVTLWPWAYELFRLAESVGLSPVGQSTLRQIEQLVRGLRSVPPWLVFAALAVVPAVAEEWFFRGFVLAWLRVRTRPAWAILGSAAIFGLFHVFSPTMLAPERFLPTFLLGIVVGWICWRTGSLFPGMALHLGHNAILPWIALHQDRLDWLWGTRVGDATPPIAATWLAVAALCNVIGIALVGWRARPTLPSHGDGERDST